MTSAALHSTPPLLAPALRMLQGPSLPARLVQLGSLFVAGASAAT